MDTGKINHSFRPVSAIILAILLISVCAVAGAQQAPSLPPASLDITSNNNHKKVSRIFILNSYNHGHSWTDNMLRGINDSFVRSGMNIETYHFFMDMRRAQTGVDYLKQFKGMLDTGYKGVKFDAVMVCENDALSFVSKYRDDLFPGVPVIYTSINEYGDSMLEGHKDFIGTRQITDYADTIKAALKLRPGTRKIIVLSDETPTGLDHTAAVKKLEPGFDKSLSFQYWSLGSCSLTEMGDKLASLPNDSIVLLLGHFKDKDGNTYSVQESAAFLSSRCAVPCFIVTDSRMGMGPVGGILESGYYYGQASADMVVKILKGAEISSIPAMKQSPNKYMFDFKALRRFNIPERNLPPGSIIINKPASIYEQYRKEVIATAIVLSVMGLSLLVMALEILRRKRVEKKMRASEQRFRSLVEHLPQSIFIKDRNSAYISCNVRYAKNLGINQKEIAGKDDFAFHPKELAEKYRADDKVVMDTGAIKDIDEHYYVNGVERWAHTIKVPFHDEQRQIIGVLGISEDITERRELEQRLHQSEKMDAIGKLAGGVAHDFNNQLLGIMGYAEMIYDQAENQNHREFADNIVKASRRSADLTKQLLAFARKGKFISVPVNLHDVIHEVISLLKHSIDKRIIIRHHLDADSPIVLGDPTQLQNAILNLAINARDAMPDGGELTLSTATADLNDDDARELYLEKGRYLAMTVTDTGTGMDAETQKHMFEPFYTTKGHKKGTGLGLAAVYGAVKNHHGAVDVLSELGRGSIFKIYLPLLKDAGIIELKDAAAVPARGDARILIVDDEEVARNFGTDILRRLGYKVTVCKDGEEAVAFYRDFWQNIDLVVLDMVMPKMGGRDTFIAMRKINPNIKAILASVYSIEGEAQEILGEGVLGFVQKPFSIPEFSQKVVSALNGRKSDVPAQKPG